MKSDLQEITDQVRTAEADHAGLHYRRVTDSARGCERGTVLLGEAIVHGYPRIGRVLALRPGLGEQFRSPFWVEEKVNGYNVRIFRYEGRPLALTRGGFVCPFTTDRLPELLDLAVFDEEPDLVICGEVAGPDNPYVESAPPFVVHDVALFTFDLMRLGQPTPLPAAEAYELIDRARLPAVTRFGRYTTEDIAAIQAIARRLDSEGHEGIVFKEDSARARRAKYVTAASAISDIQSTAPGLMEVPPEYFLGRILRLVLFLREEGLTRDAELDRRLGAAFLDGPYAAVEQFQREQRVSHTYRCRLRERDNALALVQHINQVSGHAIQVTLRDLRQEGAHWVVEFDRLYPSLNGLLGHLLHGGLLYD